MPDTADLEKRIRALEDREGIKEVTHQYGRCLDNCLWDEVRDVFADNVTTSYTDGAYKLTGVDAIVQFLSRAYTRERKKAGMGSVHLLVQPEIELLSETTARATWTFTYTAYDPANKKASGQAAYYHNEYTKVDGRWKISHIGYKVAFSPAYELPGLELKPGKFAYSGDAGDAAANPAKAPKAAAHR